MLLSRRATYVASPGHAITEQFNDLSSKFLDALEVTKYAAGYLGRGKKTPVTQAHWGLLTFLIREGLVLSVWDRWLALMYYYARSPGPLLYDSQTDSK